MTPLSVACIILGCYYASIRFPLAIKPNKTVKVLRIIWGSKTTMRLFGIAWFIPWIIVVYFTIPLETKLSRVILVWGIIGTVISLYIILFASRYRKQMMRRIENITPLIRVFALLTAFLGVFLIYLGIKVF